MTGHYAAQLQVRPQSSGRAYPDDVFHIVLGVKLIGVDADGGHTHAGGHDAHRGAFIEAGIALNAPDVVHQLQFRQEILRDELGPQRVAGHQYGFGEIALVCFVMRGSHDDLLIFPWPLRP